MIYLGVYGLSEDVPVPTYGTKYSSCFDLVFYPTQPTVSGYTVDNNPVERVVNGHGEISIVPGDRLLVPTGLVMKLEQKITVEGYNDIIFSAAEKDIGRYGIRLHARSGLALKRGLVLANAEGVVDADYQYEVFVMLANISNVGATIKKGDRIAQGEVVCNEQFEFVKLNEMPSLMADRTGGFGSTGVMSVTK